MKWICNALNRLLFGKHEVYKWSFSFLLIAFSFATYYFNRTGLSIIAVVVLLLMFLITLLRLLAKRDFKFDWAFIFLITCLTFVFVSNAIKRIFSYDFLVFFGIFYCSYLFVKTDVGKHLTLLFLCLLFGASIGCLFIFAHYCRIGLSKNGDSFFGNADGLSDGAASFAVLTLLATLSLFLRRKQKRRLLLLFAAVPFLLVIALFHRVGPILKLVFFGILAIGIYFWKKDKLLFGLLIVFCGAALICILFIPTTNSLLQRIQMGFAQISDLDIVVEGSFRERTLMVFRDFLSSLRFPLIGNGEYFYTAYNVVPSHNLFGSVGENYGLLLLFALFGAAFFFAMKNRKNPAVWPFAFYYLFLVSLSVFYGTCFLSRVTYFGCGALFGASYEKKTGADIVSIGKVFRSVYQND